MTDYIICKKCKRMFCTTSNAICPYCATATTFNYGYVTLPIKAEARKE